ncbi:unnamed protein product [Effrenium voratum]|nr:unnamed protein product [Effrenium voratum]
MRLGCNDIAGMDCQYGVLKTNLGNCDALALKRPSLNFTVLGDFLINQVVDLVVWAYAPNVINVVKQRDIRAAAVVHAWVFDASLELEVGSELPEHLFKSHCRLSDDHKGLYLALTSAQAAKAINLGRLARGFPLHLAWLLSLYTSIRILFHGRCPRAEMLGARQEVSSSRRGRACKLGLGGAARSSSLAFRQECVFQLLSLRIALDRVGFMVDPCAVLGKQRSSGIFSISWKHTGAAANGDAGILEACHLQARGDVVPYSSLAEYKGKGPIVVLVADRQQAVEEAPFHAQGRVMPRKVQTLARKVGQQPLPTLKSAPAAPKKMVALETTVLRMICAKDFMGQQDYTQESFPPSTWTVPERCGQLWGLPSAGGSLAPGKRSALRLWMAVVRAAADDFSSMISVQEGETISRFWLAPAVGGRSGPAKRTPIKESSVEAVEVEASHANMGPAQNQQGGSTKKQAVEHRKLPEGCTLEVVPGDGGCLMHSLAKGIAHNKKTTKLISSLQLRSEAIAYLRRPNRLEQYRAHWNGLGPAGKKEELATPTAWAGHLELQAVAELYGLTIYAT